MVGRKFFRREPNFESRFDRIEYMATQTDTKSNEPAVLSVPEAARRLGISNGTAYEAVRQGRLPVIRIGARRVLVPREAFERLLSEGQQ